MTAIEAIKKIKIALGIEKMEAIAELIDGTQVHVDNEFAVGEQLHVVTEDGSYAPAPEGTHETTEGKLITVDAAGVITTIEEKEEVAAEEVKEEEKVEVKEEMAEETEEAKTEVKVEVAPEMVQQVIDAITPLIDQVKELETEMKALKASFSKFSNEPAATPVRNNFKAENAEKKELIDARLDMLAKIRRGK